MCKRKVFPLTPRRRKQYPHGPNQLQSVISWNGGILSSLCYGFAKIAALLHALLSKPKKSKTNMNAEQFVSLWKYDCDRTFQDLKTKLTSAPVLGYQDFSKESMVEVDANLHGLGAVFSQVRNKKSVVIAYASRTLIPT